LRRSTRAPNFLPLADSQIPMSDTPHKASLAVIFLTVFIDLLGFGMVLPLLPIYAKDFAEQLGIEPGHSRIGLLIGLLMSSFSIMQFIFAPLWGRLSDRIGRRPVLMVGLAGSVAFYTLFGVATLLKSLPLLFASRIGAGISGATISTAQAYIADATTLQTRARGMALIGAAFGLGFTFGPLFGFLAVPSGQGDPGPGPGYAAAGLSAIALALAYFKLPESLRPGSQAQRPHWFDTKTLRQSLATPAVGLMLATIFICVFSFANLESTLSLMINAEDVGYAFDFRQVCLTYAFIGFVLTMVQGGIVRPIATRVPESVMASGGAVVEIIGFLVLTRAAVYPSTGLLLTGLGIVVTGFAFVTPSLNSLLSRWSDPARQGGILGIGQSISALARILGPMAGVPLFENRALANSLGVKAAEMPLLLATGLTILGLLFIAVAASRGRDFEQAAE
jgi:DHA1 family tetracycline resistance protein-like MFS transporter